MYIYIGGSRRPRAPGPVVEDQADLTLHCVEGFLGDVGVGGLVGVALVLEAHLLWVLQLHLDRGRLHTRLQRIEGDRPAYTHTYIHAYMRPTHPCTCMYTCTRPVCQPLIVPLKDICMYAYIYI